MPSEKDLWEQKSDKLIVAREKISNEEMHKRGINKKADQVPYCNHLWGVLPLSTLRGCHTLLDW